VVVVVVVGVGNSILEPVDFVFCVSRSWINLDKMLGIDNLWGVLVFGQPERSVCWQMSGPVLGCRLMSECMKLGCLELRRYLHC
jgi:hypothetical protein